MPIVLSNLQQTCDACPSQWEGNTIDGRYFYARYRWGYLSVEIGGVKVFGKQVGGEFDGWMSTEEMLSYIGIDV